MMVNILLLFSRCYVCSNRQQITLQVDASDVDLEIMRERDEALRQLEVS